VLKNIKINPRVIVHGVPAEMIPDKIKIEIIAQNFDDIANNDLKITHIYIYIYIYILDCPES